MTARSIAVPLLPQAPRALGASPPARQSGFALRLHLAFGAILLLLALLTALASQALQGAAAMVVLALGASAMLLTLFTAAWLRRRLVLPLAPATRAAADLSQGDLDVSIDLARAGELRPLLQAIDQLRERLCDVVGDVRIGTGDVALNASQISRESDTLAQHTETQADSLQETAASMEELTAAVRQNAGTAQQAHELVRAATERAEQGGAVMRQMVQTMDAIRASSASIRDIIGVIDGIAFQTNILALNAAVEAARAGDQGRGFAVVAAEVRTLAQRSAQAARDVKGLIVDSAEKVDSGGARAQQAGDAMAEIVGSVRRVADLIGHIDLASREQSSGIETINTAIARIDGTTQHNASLVKGAARTAAALHERAKTLTNTVSAFRLGSRERGTAQEAVALVRAGAEFLRAQGRAAFIAEVNKLDAGRFIHRDLYLMALGLDDAVWYAHGYNVTRLGTGPEVKDIDGKAFPREMARLAREQGEGWVDYKWEHPVSGQVFTKSGFVKREGDLAIYAAVYKV